MSVDKSKPQGANGHLDLAQEEWLRLMPDGWDGINATPEGYIELPKDADGQIIHVGDMLDGYGRTIRVKELRNAGTWHLVDELGNEWHGHEAFVHVQPDSWERILTELAERVTNSGHQWGLDAPAVTAEFVERCKRLAGGGA